MDIGIITGASSGLGREFAKQIDTQYQLDEVWLVARREERLKRLSEELNTPTKIFTLDLTKPESLEKLAQKLQQQEYHVRILVNNAGFGKKGNFSEIELAKQIDMVDLNVRALVHLTHIALPFMQSGDHILQIASSAGFIPMGRFAVYSGSKAFVINFSIGIGVELEDKGIHVTAVCPGPVDTEFQAVAYEEPGRRNTSAPSARDVVTLALKDVRRGRMMSVYGSRIKLIWFAARFFTRKFMAKMALKRN